MTDNNFIERLIVAACLSLLAVCMVSTAINVYKMRKEQQEITHYLKLLYNDYEEYD